MMHCFLQLSRLPLNPQAVRNVHDQQCFCPRLHVGDIFAAALTSLWVPVTAMNVLFSSVVPLVPFRLRLACIVLLSSTIVDWLSHSAEHSLTVPA